MSYATPTHQNLSVWGRRFNVQINDLDKGAKLADAVFGKPSRKGILVTVAIKAVSERTGLQPSGIKCWMTGVAIGTIVYDHVYGNTKHDNIKHSARVIMNKLDTKGRLTDSETYDLWLEHKELVEELVTLAETNRHRETSRASVANVILNKIR